jgi:hypothetical protein
MRDSGQKNAPHLKKGGVPAGSPAACGALLAVTASPSGGCRRRPLAVLPLTARAL